MRLLRQWWAGGWRSCQLGDGDGTATLALHDDYCGDALVYARDLAESYRTARRLTWMA